MNVSRRPSAVLNTRLSGSSREGPEPDEGIKFFPPEGTEGLAGGGGGGGVGAAHAQQRAPSEPPASGPPRAHTCVDTPVWTRPAPLLPRVGGLRGRASSAGADRLPLVFQIEHVHQKPSPAQLKL